MLVCQNQPCGARWDPAELTIRNEGQGLIFRCPLCGARNHVKARTRADGTVTYAQQAREPSGQTGPNVRRG